MSRIDDALRRARGEHSGPEEAAADLDAPWEFGDDPPVSRPQHAPAPLARVAPEPSEVAQPAQATAADAVDRSDLGPMHAHRTADELFVSLNGDEKLVGGGLRQAMVEEYRKLASSLHQAQIDRNFQVLLVASAVPGEGKSLTAANLALTLSSSYSRRTLLIDADLRRPSLHTVFKTPVTSGLSEGLDAATRSRVSAIQLSTMLALLPAGRPVQNPVPLLTSDRMGDIIRDARQHFDWVIIDTPPVGLLTDANLLTKEVDAALLVIHANRTPYALVQKAIQTLGKAKIFGVVMNRLEDQITMAGKGYSGYKGYYKDYLQDGR